MRNQTEFKGTTTTVAGTQRRQRRRAHDEHQILRSMPFQPVELIATGGMSCVYRALDPRMNRPIAIKVLRQNLGDHPRAISTFEAEYEVARRISHGGIVPIHERGRVDGLPYLIMDWVDGAPLTALAATGPMPEAHAADIVA